MNRRLLLPREWGPIRYSELWHEGETLLYVRSSRFSDFYARYRLHDIQAFVLTELPLWNLWRASWFGVLVFLAVVLLLVPGGWWRLLAVLPGLSLVRAVAFLVRGARCRLVLHTAVSTVTIEAVRTMAQAREILPELRRLVEAAQGRLSADGLTVVNMPPVPETLPETRNAPLLLHVFFSTLVLHALMLAGFYFGNKMATGLSASATLLLAELVLSALAALRWRVIGTAFAVVAVAVLVVAAGDAGVLLYTAGKSFGGLVEAASRPGARPDAVEWLWIKEQTVGRAAWHAVAGLVGWVLLLMLRGGRR